MVRIALLSLRVFNTLKGEETAFKRWGLFPKKIEISLA
jgi:hypothetical protein